MKRFMSTLKKKSSSPTPNGTSTSAPAPAPAPTINLPSGDAPEAVVVREVVAFCESGAPDSRNAGDEYLHLPAIVDAAESSPTAAREAANTIRRFLSKEYYQRGWAQYNAIMLTRILTDNPGRPFTQNFDKPFVSTTKEMLRECKDSSVQQILRETLDYIEAEKVNTNDTLGLLVQMWRKEKSKAARFASGPMYSMGFGGQQQYQRQHRTPRVLPPPDELAARVEEAKTTARLLVQTVQSTPQAELLNNELVKEFAERSRAAHKSVQNYMNCENPRPDEDTMLTLIETNDQLNVAMSKHQRALLQARKAAGIATPSPQVTPSQEPNSYMPQHTQGQNVYSNINRPPQNTRSPPPPAPNETFSPPPGPPPKQRNQPQHQTFNYEDAYSADVGAPNIPSLKPTHNRTSSAEYGVSDNPFSDDAEAPQQPTRHNNAIFGRPAQPRAQPQPTQSYVNRQDSSANNITMHGGSPPPTQSA